MIDIKEINELKILDRIKEDKSTYFIVKIEKKELLATLVFERYEAWDSIKTDSSRIGKNSPKCCHPPPENNGFYLCNCEKHIIHISDNTTQNLRQVIELPEKLSL